MALSIQDKKILEEIVSVDGACLHKTRCKGCPFRGACLPEFLNPVPLSQPQRLKMAFDVLTHHLLIDEDMSVDEVQEYTWNKK